ncbi:MAG: hypothetical protein ACTHLW_01040 [Verrucomicrobiota bacterium]
MKRNPPKPASIEFTLTQHQLPMQMCGPKLSVENAKEAALRVAQHLETPSVIDYLAQPYFESPGATLCVAPRRPTTATPTALFAEMKLSVADIPEQWMPEYADWMAKLNRSREFTAMCLHLDCKTSQAPPVKDPIVAGLMLYLHSSSVDGETRRQWLDVALNSPEGSWLAAEGLHLPEEREAILNGVQGDGSLLWWTSQIFGFQRLVPQLALSKLNLYGGLMLATVGQASDLEKWLRQTALAACENGDAACAALVLQPNAHSRDKAVWLSTLQNPNHAFCAYQAVRWARYTWSRKNWEKLKKTLETVCVNDRGQVFYLWFRDIAPEKSAAALGIEDVDLLWAVELLSSLPEVDDYAFRFQMGERLDASGQSPASIVLSYLNQRLARKSNGTTI